MNPKDLITLLIFCYTLFLFDFWVVILLLFALPLEAISLFRNPLESPNLRCGCR